MKSRIRGLLAVCLIGSIALVYAGMNFWAAPRLMNRLKANLPFPVEAAQVRWAWPIGICLNDVRVPDPAQEQPFIVEIKRLVVRLPVWAVFSRPLPISLEADSPHFKLTSRNIGLMSSYVRLSRTDWLEVSTDELSEEEAEGAGAPQRETQPLPSMLPIEIKFKEGVLEALDENIQSGKPIFILRHLNVSTSIEPTLPHLTVRVKGTGFFETEKGERIGLFDSDLFTRMQDGYMKGFLRLRHERLGDFRNLYTYAPRPILIEGGIADTRIEFEVENHNHLRMTARCTVQNLDMTGQVGDVSWAQIMHAVEDDQRRYTWQFTVDGNVQDPKFDPHDRVLSEVEWKMKEEASLKGLKIKEQMFFYADTPSSFEDSTSSFQDVPEAIPPS